MRVRLTVEYETYETLEYERLAWNNGDVRVTDFMPPFDDENSIVKIEEVKTDA